jgi:hypothetical protein
MADYQEYSLFNSTGRIEPHHIMKIPHSKFNIEQLKPPVTLTRMKKAKVEEEPAQPNTYFQKKTKGIQNLT